MKDKVKNLSVANVLEKVGTILTACLIVSMGISAISVAVNSAINGI